MLRMIALDCCALLAFVGTTFLGVYMERECVMLYRYWERLHGSLFAFNILYAGVRLALVLGGIAVVYMILTRQKAELVRRA